MSDPLREKTGQRQPPPWPVVRTGLLTFAIVAIAGIAISLRSVSPPLGCLIASAAGAGVVALTTVVREPLVKVVFVAVVVGYVPPFERAFYPVATRDHWMVYVQTIAITWLFVAIALLIIGPRFRAKTS